MAPELVGPACVLCRAPAIFYCRNDAAHLCGACNQQVHATGPATQHQRVSFAGGASPPASAGCSPSAPLQSQRSGQMRHVPTLAGMPDSAATFAPPPPAQQQQQQQPSKLCASVRRAAPAGRASPFSFAQCQLGAPPPLPPACAEALAGWGAPQADSAYWGCEASGAGPAACSGGTASTLDEELMDCLAGLSADPLPTLDFSGLDLMVGRLAGSYGLAAAAPQPAAPTNTHMPSGAAAAGDDPARSGASAETTGEVLVASLSVASSGSRPGSSVAASPSAGARTAGRTYLPGVPLGPSPFGADVPAGSSGIWLRYPPASEQAPAGGPMVVVEQLAPRVTLSRSLVGFGSSGAPAPGAAVVGLRAPAVVTTGDGIRKRPAPSATSEEQAPQQPKRIRVKLPEGHAGGGGGATPRSPGTAPARAVAPKAHTPRRSGSAAAVAALAAACGGDVPPSPRTATARAAGARVVQAEQLLAAACGEGGGAADKGAAKGAAAVRRQASRARKPRPLPGAGLSPEDLPEIPAYHEGETRADKLARYRAKKLRRRFKRTVRYECRKTYADQRPRIKGRFVSPEEFAAWKEQEAEAGAGGGQGEEPADAQAEAAPRFQPVVMPAV